MLPLQTSRKYNFHVLKKKRWFFWAIRTSFWPGLMPAKSHSFFLWLAMFNLTTIFDLSTPSSMTDAFLFAGYYSGAFLYILKSVNMPPGHKWDRRKSENSISVWKTLLLSLTLTIVFSIINRISLNCELFISQLTTNFFGQLSVNYEPHWYPLISYYIVTSRWPLYISLVVSWGLLA